MPGSDFLWSIQTPGLSSGCLKRKIEGDVGSLDLQEQMIKRRCTLMNPGGDSEMCEVDDENHNEMTSQNFNNTSFSTQPSSLMQNSMNVVQGNQQLTCSGFPSLSHHTSHLSEQQQTGSSSHAQSDQQENLIMNLNDEVYSESSMPLEEEMACSFMDSDFVPNQQQYNARVMDSHSSVVVEPTAAVDRVKCYCRPTWEGLLEMTTYVSDYY